MAGEKRRTPQGWSLRINPERAQLARDGGWWLDKTAADYAEELAAKEPNRILVVDAVRTLDAATLLGEAKTLARGFIKRGFKPGDVVSMMLPNWHESTVVALAACIAGVVLHPIVTAYREAEVAFMLGDCGSRMIFVPEVFRGYDFAAMMKTVREQLDRPPEVVIVRGERGEFTDYAKMFAEDVGGARLPKVDPDSVKILIYTSGTTGRAKGVIHTHNSSLAVCVQVNRHWRINGDDRFFIPSPVGHIGGSMYAFDMPVLFGARAVLQDVWDADEGVKIIDEQGCTFIAGATPFLQQLLASSRAVGSRLPSMRLFICGGASVPPALIREAKDYLTNCTVTRVYGSTEVPVATVGSPDPGDTDHAAETDGRPGAATAKLVDADGKEGEEGEIWLRGPQMLVGYLHLEDEQSTFDEDGFFRTGDLARRVDGSYLVVSGRSKDLIIRNGENISPKEVEDILGQHPKIADIAIVGLPNQKTGERACAVIVPRAGEEPDVADLRSFLEERRVARFKIPEQVELWTELPRNPAGKILKNKIRDALLAEMRQGAKLVEFDWTPEQDAYRERIRTVLARELPADWDHIAVHGPGSDEQTAFSRKFCPILAEEGLFVPHWPSEYGGEGLPSWLHFILGEELWAAGEPRGGQYMNVNWIGPTLMRYGNEAQKEKHLTLIKSGQVLWCQGFSEPSAGSDLASLRTKAEPVEGGYSVTGSKIWTSYAGHADFCFLLARTSSEGKGAIVILLLDMKSPGIQVKKIPALIGEGDIHEVFFDEVFVPAEDRLGEEGQAWAIITGALSHERIGIPRYAFSRRTLDRAIERLKESGRFDDPVVQDRAGRAIALCEAARLMVYKVIDERSKNSPANAFGNLARWSLIRADSGVNEFLTEFLPEGLLGEDPMQQAHHQRAIAAGIASGAAEIQLNLAATGFLDLPREPRRGL